MCVDWLVRCNVIPADHPVTSPDAQFQELAFILRDGVLLCHLLNVLNRDTVSARSVSQNPQSSLVCVFVSTNDCCS
jgi:guanine nucleotide exchange factor VAV